MNATPRARQLRKHSTDAERALWRILRNRQLAGYKFRRQVSIGPYIADFVWFEKKLVVEIDGGQHQERVEYDNDRTEWLESQGFRVLRFWNNEAMGQMEAVTSVILETLNHPHLNPLPSRERRYFGGTK